MRQTLETYVDKMIDKDDRPTLPVQYLATYLIQVGTSDLSLPNALLNKGEPSTIFETTQNEVTMADQTKDIVMEDGTIGILDHAITT
jgi:hypothetical protein